MNLFGIMLKFVDTAVTFSEFPNEISLCINISNCPNKCKNCHSAYLQEDIGTVLDLQHLINLIDANKGITCIGLMGGDRHPEEIDDIAQMIKAYYPELKVGWYSGNDEISKDIDKSNFDFIKVGSYIEKLGGLASITTNQRMYRIVSAIDEKGDRIYSLLDITHLFWKNNIL